MNAQEIIESYKKLVKETEAAITTWQAGIKFVFSPKWIPTATEPTLFYYGSGDVRIFAGAEQLFTTCIEIGREERE